MQGDNWQVEAIKYKLRKILLQYFKISKVNILIIFWPKIFNIGEYMNQLFISSRSPERLPEAVVHIKELKDNIPSKESATDDKEKKKEKVN